MGRACRWSAHFAAASPIPKRSLAMRKSLGDTVGPGTVAGVLRHHALRRLAIRGMRGEVPHGGPPAGAHGRLLAGAHGPLSDRRLALPLGRPPRRDRRSRNSTTSPASNSATSKPRASSSTSGHGRPNGQFPTEHSRPRARARNGQIAQGTAEMLLADGLRHYRRGQSRAGRRGLRAGARRSPRPLASRTPTRFPPWPGRQRPAASKPSKRSECTPLRRDASLRERRRAVRKSLRASWLCRNDLAQSLRDQGLSAGDARSLVKVAQGV